MRDTQEELRRERRRERRRFSLLIGLVIGVGVAFVAAVQEFRNYGTDRIAPVSVADFKARAKTDQRPAPDFRQEGLDGSTIDSADYRGRILVVNFWASWCVPCRAEAPHLQAAWEKYRDQGVAFLGVNYQDDRYSAGAYEDEFRITFPSVFDPGGTLAGRFRPWRAATLLFIYSLGLGIPFLLLAVGYNRARSALAWFRRHGRQVEIFGGGLLVAMGVLMITGQLKLFLPLVRWYSRLDWPPI